jgi:predicted DNA-binding WGR domain protein
MPDDLRSPIKHHLVLHRRDPEHGVARFYSLLIERDLFGRVVLVRNWGRIGTNRRGLVEEFAGEIEASQALQAVMRTKNKRPRGALEGDRPYATAQMRFQRAASRMRALAAAP